MKRFALLLLLLSVLTLFVSCGNMPKEESGDTSIETAGTGTEMEKTVDITEGTMKENETKQNAELLYMGHASIRITTTEGKVIYIDPFAGDGYGPAADLILVTHAHYDHTCLDLIRNKNPDCETITWKEALANGAHQTFELGYVTVEAVEAGYNRNHDVNSCVGYILTLSDGVSVYVSGDTSTTGQMPQLAEKKIDYAFFCCDGIYNMDLEEAAECARLVGAKHNIPYHIIAANSETSFDRSRAEQFSAPNKLIVDVNETIKLVRE